MGLLSNIVNKYERGANYELGNSLSSSAVSSLFGSGGSNINVREEYSGFVWKCINARSEAIANQSLFIERKVGEKWQQDANHEFLGVLEGNMGQYDQYELLEAHQVSLDLFGESFWYYSKGERSSKPMGIYLLDPNHMSVVVSNNKVSGYIYQKDGGRLALDLDEVDHYRIYNPNAQFRGLGPMQAAGWFVRSSRYVNTYINNFLENNAIPAGVIVAKDGFTNDEDWKLFKQGWAEKHTGINSAGKTGFVRGADLQFVKTGLSLGEVDFAKVKNTSRDDIMAMFGVSKPIIGIFEDINRASAVTARQMWAYTFTEPSMRRISRKVSKRVGNWYGDQFRLGFSNPVPEDREIKLQEYDKLVGRAFTPNETRTAYGLAPIAGGDELNTVAKAAEPTPVKSLGKVTITTKNNKADFSYEMKESFRSEMESLQHKYEQQFLQATDPVLKDQKKRVLDQLQPKKVVNAYYDETKEAANLTEVVFPVFIELAKEQGALAAMFAGNEDTSFKITPVIEKYIRDSVSKASLGFSIETQAAISKALADGLLEGESIARIGKRINAIYDDVLGVKTPGYRIERLARTEVIKTSNEITETAYKQTGLVQKKELFANPGACEFCAALNGSIVQLGATFVPKEGKIEGIDGGTRINSYEDIKHPPIHPQCRCTLVPVIEGIT